MYSHSMFHMDFRGYLEQTFPFYSTTSLTSYITTFFASSLPVAYFLLLERNILTSGFSQAFLLAEELMMRKILIDCSLSRVQFSVLFGYILLLNYYLFRALGWDRLSQVFGNAFLFSSTLTALSICPCLSYFAVLRIGLWYLDLLLCFTVCFPGYRSFCHMGYTAFIL